MSHPVHCDEALERRLVLDVQLAERDLADAERVAPWRELRERGRLVALLREALETVRRARRYSRHRCEEVLRAP